MRRIVWLLAVAAPWLFTGCRSFESTENIPTVESLESGRYMGRWYEIARMPHSFEQGLDFVQAEYSLQEDGTIQVRNSGIRDGEAQSIEGTARPRSPDHPADLRVTFFRPFSGVYRVIGLEPDYSAAIVTGPDRGYLWILSRTPELPEERLRSYLDRVSRWGFDTGRLQYPRQN